MSLPVIRFMDEYRDPALVKDISHRIHSISRKKINLMEVCGGHTMAIFRNGLTDFLPDTITLMSGPGCPVCVSGQRFIDHAIALAGIPGMIMTTYGDLIRVPGSTSSLEKVRSEGGDIRIVYSVLDAVAVAKKNPKRPVVFLGIGFETTAPASAVAVLTAKKEGINNFFLLSSHKVMPPALEVLASGGARIHGFIAPGHVSAITGYNIYRPLTEKYRCGIVVAGFEPADILQAVLMLVLQIESGNITVENEYKRVVKPDGNRKALEIMQEAFIPVDADWRGLGMIPESGLAPDEKYAAHDASRNFEVKVAETPPPKGCICGEILKGEKNPGQCSLFAKLCSPENPVGACMVSAEGACSVYYKYKR